MKGYYFFKAHISSVLDDADINLLDNWVWKLYWQCYAVAQEETKDGLLPPVAKLAYRIRANEKTLMDALEAMRDGGELAIKTDDGWLMTRFASEQKSATDTERVQAFRKRERKRRNLPDYANETVCSQKKSRGEEEKEVEEKREDKLENLVVVRELYEQNIGVIVPNILTELENAVAKYPLKWTEDAIKIAVGADKRRWDYVSGILRNWETKGRGSKKTKGNDKDSSRYFQDDYADYID